MIKKIINGVWKVLADSNVYYIEDINTIIDTGNRCNRDMLTTFLGQIIDLNKIENVIFTHLHYDHIGNFDLFSNAKFYCSSDAIKSLKENRSGTILNDDISGKFNVDLLNISELNLPDKYEIIYTPGHTKGSICLWDKDNKILFSGDTLLNGCTGRTDLPTSNPEEMKESVVKLIQYNFKILCAGHEY